MASCLDDKTVQGFKDQFPRDFPYLPVWVAGTYNTGDTVLYNVDSLTYVALKDGVISIPDTLGVDWRLATTDEKNAFVLDGDITKAFTEASLLFNEALVPIDCDGQLHIYYYLTAFFLVFDLKAAAEGVASTGSFNVSARSVGSVSENYSIPQEYLDSSALSFYTDNRYGIKYLNLVMPYIRGNVVGVISKTNP